MLATLGEYEFEVSMYNIATFTDLRFSNAASYTEHRILGGKGLLEFTGLSASTCSLNIHLEEGLSEDLAGTIDYFYSAMNKGEALLFMIGSAVMGEGFWVIESLEESYPEISGKGELLTADLTLKLKEYVTVGDEA